MTDTEVRDFTIDEIAERSGLASRWGWGRVRAGHRRRFVATVVRLVAREQRRTPLAPVNAQRVTDEARQQLAGVIPAWLLWVLIEFGAKLLINWLASSRSADAYDFVLNR